MASITQRIPNFLGGVSKQPDSQKAPNEVRECDNAVPDPTYGLTKRPGSKWIKTLATISPYLYKNAKWFYIHRDGDEKYLGCIAPSYLTVETAGENINTTSLTNLPTTGGNGTGLTVDATVTDNKVTAFEINQLGSGYDHDDLITVSVGGVNTTCKVKIDADTANASSPIATWNISDEDNVYPVTAASNTTIQTASRKYLYGLRDNFHITTVQDTTIITNTNATVATAAATTDTTGKHATVVLNGIEANQDYTITLEGVTLESQDSGATPTATSILTALEGEIPTNTYDVNRTPLTLEITKRMEVQFLQ